MPETIERVYLVLDTNAETRKAIDIAMRLAARAKVRLHAMFVEDEDLLNLARLPIAREVVAGGIRSLTMEDVKLHLQAAASRAQQEINATARLYALEASFEIVSGAVKAALSTASEHDLVVIGALTRPVAGHFRVASRWSALLQMIPGPLLLTRDTGHNNGRVAALVRERSTGSARLLKAAGRIAELVGGALTIVCSSDLARASDFAKWLDEQIATYAVRLRIEPAPEPAVLHQWIVGLNPSILAIEAAAAEGQRIKEFAESFDGDLLVVP